MKINLRQFTGALAMGCLALVVSGCSGINILDKDYESYSVVMEESSGTLVILSNPQGWEADGKNKGYVGFEPGKIGHIVLSLAEANQTCEAGANWVITKIELSKNGNPSTQKGLNFGGNQKGWLKKAFPQADENGVLFDVKKGNGEASKIVENRNNNNGRQWAYYQVTATNCSNGQVVMTDPGVQNGGRR